MADTTATIGVLVVTLAIILFFGVYYGRAKLEGVEDFLSGRGTMGIPLGLGTFIAYAAGSGLLFSPPEVGATIGLAAVIGYGFAIAAPFLVYLSVAPKIRERMPKGHTIPEYARVRYGTPMYILTMLTTLFYMFILMTANLTGIALALNAIAGVPLLLTLSLVMGTVMIYTVQGGLLSAIFTDVLQAVVLIPLLVVTAIVAVFQLGGPATMFTEMQAQSPALVDITNPAGVRFAIYIIIALIGAELLNQSLWQRAHAAKDSRSLQVAFAGAALAVVPLGILAGLYGVIAGGLGFDFVSPSAALPTVVEATLGLECSCCLSSS
jgi:Na+/proline symporter